MMTNPQIAKILGISDQLLRYHLKKKDAPEPVLKRKKRHVVKYYDADEIKCWWES